MQHIEMREVIIIKKSLLFLAAFCTTAAVYMPVSVSYAAENKAGIPVQHVLLISVDGLHASDLTAYISENPNSNLAAMSSHGISYTHAMTSKPSDSFPGLLALLTGGSPNSTGVFYDDTYDRRLIPSVNSHAGDKLGTAVLFDESVDVDSNAINGGDGLDPNALPRDPATKQPVYPHNYVRVNNIFSVAKAAGKRTAWCDKHLSYDLVTGPSGKDVDDLYTPEIAANGDATKSIAATEANDDLKVTAVLNEINGKDHAGKNAAAVPAIFGMNFQAVSVAQKLPGNGYKDAAGTFSDGLKQALNHTDQSLGKIVEKLKQQNLYSSTVVIITAKHGQSPIDPAKTRIVNKKSIIEGIPPEWIAHVTTDDIAMIWLTNSAKTAAAVDILKNNKVNAAIQTIFSASAPKWAYNDPTVDSRVPDIIIQPVDGVIYTKPGKKIAEHGGFSADDTNVALLVSSPRIKAARQNSTPIKTMQVAPTILKMLGLAPESLQAVQKEHTAVLPELDVLK